jgi:hypothetical protein
LISLAPADDPVIAQDLLFTGCPARAGHDNVGIWQ